MCVIIDNNVAAKLLLTANPVETWLRGNRGNPRLVMGGLLNQELSNNREVLKYLRSLEQAGRIRRFEPAPLSKAHNKQLASNDPHVIGLALASGARTLCTADAALMDDFRNPKIINEPRGKVYSDERHVSLLKHTPKSCGVRA